MLITITIYCEETYRVLKQNTGALSLSSNENAVDKNAEKTKNMVILP
jgi:hypothetical protein